MFTEAVPCGPNSAAHKENIQAYIDAGYDEVYL